MKRKKSEKTVPEFEGNYAEDRAMEGMKPIAIYGTACWAPPQNRNTLLWRYKLRAWTTKRGVAPHPRLQWIDPASVHCTGALIETYVRSGKETQVVSRMENCIVTVNRIPGAPKESPWRVWELISMDGVITITVKLKGGDAKAGREALLKCTLRYFWHCYLGRHFRIDLPLSDQMAIATGKPTHLRMLAEQYKIAALPPHDAMIATASYLHEPNTPEKRSLWAGEEPLPAKATDYLDRKWKRLVAHEARRLGNLAELEEKWPSVSDLEAYEEDVRAFRKRHGKDPFAKKVGEQ